MPYFTYCMTSLAVFLSLALVAWLLLSYGRHHIASSAMAQELSESSHAASNGVVYVRRDGQSTVCMSLTALWYLVGTVNCFALVWGVLGFYWLASKSSCDATLESVRSTSPREEIRSSLCLFDVNVIHVQMVYTVAVLLTAFSCGGFILSCVLKLESCFPFPLDPSPLHGRRVHHTHTQKGVTRTMTTRLREELGLTPKGVGAGGQYSKVMDDSLHDGPEH